MTRAIAAAAMLALIIAACTTTADTDIRLGIAPDADIIPGFALDTDIITEIAPVTDIIPETAPGTDTIPGMTQDTNVIPGTNACGASDYQSLIGARFSGSALPARLDHRIIRPRDTYTGDYVPSRLNIFVDEDGAVIEVNCG